MNSVYLSYDGMTDTLGQSQVIPYLIGLSKNGYSISLISCEKKQLFEKNAAHIHQLLTAHNIDWHPLFYTKKPPVLSTVWDISRMKRKLDALHRQKDFKLVHCRSYITSLIGEKFCKKHDIPFLFDMRGFWADERVEGNIWKLSNPIFAKIYAYFKRKEIDFFNSAAAIVSLTHAGKKVISSWPILPGQKEKIEVIPCSADFDLFQPASPESRANARLRLGLAESDFVLAYLGSIGTWYLLDEMMDLFAALHKEKPHAYFYILTADSSTLLYEKAKQRGIPKQNILVEFASRKEVPEKLAAADWGVSFIKPSFSKTASSPTKMGEMLAMGIPLIVNDQVGDVEKILNEVNGGICLHDFKESSYAAAISSMKLLTWQEKQDLRERSYSVYSLEKAVATYVSIYRKLLGA